MNLILVLVLCSLANDYSFDLICESHYTATDDCAGSFRELTEVYLTTGKFVKSESCSKIEKIEHARIQFVPLTKEWAKVRLGNFGALPPLPPPPPLPNKQSEDYEKWFADYIGMGL